jgi:hypothetical protein
MTCLDDRRLFDVHLGDAPGPDRAHAAECPRCAARLASLRWDLARIDTVVRESAAPRRPTRPASPWRWAPVAVAAVLALAVAVGRRAPLSVANDDDAFALADELAATLALDVDAADGAASTPSTCAWGDPLLGVGCEEPAVVQIAWR